MKKNVTLGIIIILIGVIWLIGNLDIFSFSVANVFFRALGRLWPLILIGIGISILIKEKPVIKLIVWILIVLVVLLYGIYGLNTSTREYTNTHENNRLTKQTNSIVKEVNTKEGSLQFAFGAGELTLDSTDQNLLQYETNFDFKYDYRLENNNTKAIVDFTKENYDFNRDYDFDKLFCDLALNKAVVWDMDIDLGAAQGTLDLRDIPVNSLDLGTGAADIDLYLGEQNKSTDVNIESGASNLDIYVPKDAGLKIKMESALSDNNLSELGLVKDGDDYISSDFDTKNVQIVFNISMGVGSLNFHVN